MKYNYLFKSFKKIGASLLLLSILITFTGCANYSSVALSDLSNMQFQISNPTLIAATDISELTQEQQKAFIGNPESNSLQMITKVFDDNDCKKYLDRDVIKKGYQPVQILIKNKSSQTFYASPDRIALPLAPTEEVARSVHTSTTKRVAWYCIGGLFFQPLFIPAIVDGLKSSDANKYLDKDFENKSFKTQIIQPHSKLTGLVFVPLDHFKNVNEISITLVNSESNKPVVLTNKLITK